MRALIYSDFGVMPSVRNVDDPVPDEDGVVVRVEACGVCRSDWHGWMGNDPDIELPHVPGHELAGVIESVGRNVRLWTPGERVTVPFVCGCGQCPQCRTGNQQVCDNQFQPGFTAWGGFAEYVAIRYADENLVRLPESMDFVTASSLGCRFVTSFRAVVDQGRVGEAEYVAVFGCGGVGLSAVMIAKAFGATVVAVDIEDDKLALATTAGADRTINASRDNVVEAVRAFTSGGADISLDALGSPDVVFDSIKCLRKRGRHVQVGLMEKGRHAVPVPIDLIIANELEILGSHGMQAHRYPEMLAMIDQRSLRPELLVTRTITLEESADSLAGMNEFGHTGITVIDRF